MCWPIITGFLESQKRLKMDQFFGHKEKQAQGQWQRRSKPERHGSFSLLPYWLLPTCRANTASVLSASVLCNPPNSQARENGDSQRRSEDSTLEWPVSHYHELGGIGLFSSLLSNDTWLTKTSTSSLEPSEYLLPQPVCLVGGFSP